MSEERARLVESMGWIDFATGLLDPDWQRGLIPLTLMQARDEQEVKLLDGATREDVADLLPYLASEDASERAGAARLVLRLALEGDSRLKALAEEAAASLRRAVEARYPRALESQWALSAWMQLAPLDADAFLSTNCSLDEIYPTPFDAVYPVAGGGALALRRGTTNVAVELVRGYDEGGSVDLRFRLAAPGDDGDWRTALLHFGRPAAYVLAPSLGSGMSSIEPVRFLRTGAARSAQRSVTCVPRGGRA